MAHGKQDDTHSCGIFVANTIEHHALASPLCLREQDLAKYRIDWFLSFVRQFYDRRATSKVSFNFIGLKMTDSLDW